MRGKVKLIIENVGVNKIGAKFIEARKAMFFSNFEIIRHVCSSLGSFHFTTKVPETKRMSIVVLVYYGFIVSPFCMLK